MPLSRRVDWRFAIAATLILTCLLTLAVAGRPGAPAFHVLHDRQTITWLSWLLLVPGIITAARRIPFGEGTQLGWLWRHLLIGSAFSIAGIVVAAAIVRLFGRWLAYAQLVAPPLVPTLAGGLLLYTLIAVSWQAMAYHRTARAREAVANALRADLAEARLANIEGKLHPHFLFNALNSIAALMREDPRHAETMLEQLSELLRATLRTNPMQEVPLDEALHLTEQYLAIERVRFGDRLRAEIAATPAARQARVPQLILQPLVENAVRHGLAPREGGGALTVTAVVEKDELLLTIEDDGVGFSAVRNERLEKGLGLRSVRAMLAQLYGTAQRFDVGARAPRGTTVRIALPYRTAAV
jgi:two-component system, LytTR family, sensor kinase